LGAANYSDRLDKAIAFSVPRIPDASMPDDQDPQSDLGAALIGADLIESVQKAVGQNAVVRGIRAHKGRGASGLGAALQVLTDVETVATALIFGAHVSRSAYRALRQRLGYRPNVSLGAAIHLAAADLIDRVNPHELDLFGSGDANDSSPDQSYTGEDAFWVIFSSFPLLYIYIVAANGRVHYMGSHEILAGKISRFTVMPGRNGKHARPDIEDDHGDSYDNI
jgi:hypothetical protein